MAGGEPATVSAYGHRLTLRFALGAETHMLSNALIVGLALSMSLGQTPGPPPQSPYSHVLAGPISQPPEKQPSAPAPAPAVEESKPAEAATASETAPADSGGFLKRFLQGYPALPVWFPNWLGKPEKKDENGGEEPESPRRALPAPLPSPPMPSGEWQGYPLIGVPPDSTVYPLMGAIYGGRWGDEIKESRIKAYGWINASGNWSTAKNSNTPDSYWIAANRYEMDQFLIRFERQVDSVQTDHIDVGFRSSILWGMDYRYMVAGGWWPGDTQLLVHNRLYGVDFTEQYIDVYIPWVTQGMIVRVGRWIACPDIETQFAPDNYMGTHSILFTFDTYTQTGVMATFMLSPHWMVQGAIHAGTDMAPWYTGATPTGMFGIRWVSQSNNDSIYAVLNDINNAEFRRLLLRGQPAGHDNFNYPVVTWQHKFNERVHTKTEAYFMWQNDAVVGGTPSIGPLKSFGGGGGIGATLPGTSLTYGTVNYTMLHLSKKTFVTFRNEWWKDERGMRSGFPGTYTSHALGFTYNLSQVFQVRPEVGYYRNWTEPAFDLGTKQGILIYGFDMTLRF
jgi:hypothetical protein